MNPFLIISPAIRVNTPMRKLIECVPNFSEGRNQKTIEAIAKAIEQDGEIMLLDTHIGVAANRTVYTFVGPPEAVQEAAFRAVKTAYELIDMSIHSGVHPRVGAMDVCPFIPIQGTSITECVQIAKDLGKRLADDLDVPVYLYEYAASSSKRKNLSAIRAGGYEDLPTKLSDPNWKPDFGPTEFRPKWGASVVGARNVLIAFNVNLDTNDVRLAQEIALSIRESGRSAHDANGKPIRIPGKLEAVRAIGWHIDEYNCAQVSTNVLDYHTTPLHVVYETIIEEAERLGVNVIGSELIGLIPLNALLEAAEHYLICRDMPPPSSEKELIQIASRYLGLDHLSPFNPEQKVIEYRIK